MNGDILQIKNLSKSFNGKGVEDINYVLNDFSLSIPENKVTALIGGNGTGKTTLFNIISGFLKPDSGGINFNHRFEELIGKEPHKISQMGIGRLFQDNHIFFDLTVSENMLIADANPWGENPFSTLFNQRKHKRIESEKIKKAEKIFSNLFGEKNDFWDKRHDLAGTLSHGQQRLLALCRLFMGDYKLVLLDEPTTGVHPKLIAKIGDIICKMPMQNISVFVIEHNMSFVKKNADSCSFISGGKVLAQGIPEVVMENDEVRKIYMGI